MDVVAGAGAFCADGRGGCGFATGSEVVRAAGNLLGADYNSGDYAAVTRSDPAWVVAFHRFAEVSIGIGVALLLAVVWPEREATPAS
jgi:hypothetical protein